MTGVDTICNCDCLEGMRSMPDGCVDLCVADPPYDFKSTRGGGAFASLALDSAGCARYISGRTNDLSYGK